MNPKLLSIQDVNKLTETEFEQIFGNIVEHFSKIASNVFKKLPVENVENLCIIAQKCVQNLSLEEKQQVLKLHPDLAGKLADLGELTAESSEEQKSAGLDSLTQEEKQKMVKLNNEYKNKFGFPFVICAKENKIPAIFNGLQERLQNSSQQELEMGIDEVKKICKLRILQIVTN